MNKPMRMQVKKKNNEDRKQECKGDASMRGAADDE
jgi:hypothetical protein